MGMQQALFMETDPSAVTPGSTTFNSGSGNFVVPAYNNLVVEIWGAGASGSVVVALGGFADGNVGGASSSSTLSMTANGGAKGNGSQATANGGTASGGTTTNGTGTNGTGAFQNSVGGSANNGGGNVSVTGSGTTNPGPTGTTPGGGGASNNDAGNVGGGGAGGGYCRSDYALGVGAAPAVGASLAYAVGAGGIAVSLSGRTSGAGTAGRVRFTWT